MKIKSIKFVGNLPVYDLSVDSDQYDKQQYTLENGVISHNTGSYYSADAIWIIGRQQEKDGTEVSGYNFVINIEKSRHVREKSKIPITVTFEGGIQKWSGLMDVAIEAGYLRNPKPGWYERVDPLTGEVIGDKMYRAKNLEDNDDFWKQLLTETEFPTWIQNRYSIGTKSLMEDVSE